jgi:uncharacterized protein YcbX
MQTFATAHSRASVAGLFIYPVKSLRGIAVSSAQIDELGLVGDRRFLVIDDSGQTLTQRAVPRMAVVDTELSSSALILRTADRPPCAIPLSSAEQPRAVSVSVWSSKDLLAEDCGETSARWLSEILEVSCRLVRIGRGFRRPVMDAQRARSTDLCSFADAFPFLATSEASLLDLNKRLIKQGEHPVTMDRFRPNLVLSGCSAFEEDTWTTFTINGTVFRAGGPCARCIVTTTDQRTGKRSKEPLRTLALYRRDAVDNSAINFGQNLIHETKFGSIQIGDVVSR